MMPKTIEEPDPRGTVLKDVAQLRRETIEVVETTPVIDIHTHLLAPQFGDASLFGIDQLLTYHYLVAETFRSCEVTKEQFWRMNTVEQADLVWKTLFVDNSPLSEATQGEGRVLNALVLAPRAAG